MYWKWVQLYRPKGEKVHMLAVIDGSVMRNIICTSKWCTQKHWLAPLTPSKVTLSVMDNHPIASEGRWMGTISVAEVETTQEFEVFNSNGVFQIILGKPWLSHVQAVHEYGTDLITIQKGGQTATFGNEEASWAQ